MTKNYFYIILLTIAFSFAGFAQEGKQQGETLGFYPNPVSNGKIYITSKTSLDKPQTEMKTRKSNERKPKIERKNAA